MMSPAFARLDQRIRDELDRTVRQTFNVYMAGTGALQRSVRSGGSDEAPVYTYPDETTVPDLVVLLHLVGATYEILKRGTKDHAREAQALVDEDPRLKHEFWRIFQERGEFWYSKEKNPAKLTKVTYEEAVSEYVHEIWRTLRNGFAHVHWLYGNSSDEDYWKAQNWSTAGAPAAFKLGSRPRANYMAYIADAAVSEWDSNKFWDQKDLRILIVPFATLRYSLHLFLNILLNDRRCDVFGRDVTAAPLFSW